MPCYQYNKKGMKVKLFIVLPAPPPPPLYYYTTIISSFVLLEQVAHFVL